MALDDPLGPIPLHFLADLAAKEAERQDGKPRTVLAAKSMVLPDDDPERERTMRRLERTGGWFVVVMADLPFLTRRPAE